MTVAPPIRCQPVPELAAVLQRAMVVVQEPFIDRPATQDRIDCLMGMFKAEVLKQADRGELLEFDVYESREIETFTCQAEHVVTDAGARMRVWFDFAGTPLEKYVTTEDR